MAWMTHIEGGTIIEGIGSIFLAGSGKMAEGCSYYFNRYLRK
jgi:hypothetical protein